MRFCSVPKGKCKEGRQGGLGGGKRSPGAREAPRSWRSPASEARSSSLTERGRNKNEDPARETAKQRKELVNGVLKKKRGIQWPDEIKYPLF